MAYFPHLPDITLTGFPRIAVDPAICGGRPTVTGTRMRVSDVREMLAPAATAAQVAADFPYASEDDARAVLALSDRFAMLWPRCGNAANAALAAWLAARWKRVVELSEGGE